MGTEPTFITRDWLNPDDSEDTGHLHIRAEACSSTVDDEPYWTIDFRLYDCFRKAELDFSYDNDISQWENRIEKVDLLIDRLNEMREWIVKHKPSGESK